MDVALAEFSPNRFESKLNHAGLIDGWESLLLFPSLKRRRASYSLLSSKEEEEEEEALFYSSPLVE